MSSNKQAKCLLCGMIVNVHKKTYTYFAHGKLRGFGQEPLWCPMSDQPVPILPGEPLFPLGQLVATPGALDALKAAGQRPEEFLNRHIVGDWGDVPPEDAQENELSVRQGFRILSAYTLKTGVKIWIITEANRSVTTLLLPDEY